MQTPKLRFGKMYVEYLSINFCHNELTIITVAIKASSQGSKNSSEYNGYDGSTQDGNDDPRESIQSFTLSLLDVSHSA